MFIGLLNGLQNYENLLISPNKSLSEGIFSDTAGEVKIFIAGLARNKVLQK